MHTALDSPVCHNCGAALAGPFCAVCGQKALPLNPSLHDLRHDVTHEILHVDGRIFRSVQKLLFSPGFLTVEQCQGRRARWISPLRLYLVFSLVYFAVASFGGKNVRVDVRGTDQETGAELRRLGFQNEEELQKTVRHAQAKWAPRVMFVLVPLCAWLVHVVCRRAGRNYPQHLYFALHVHAALFAAGAVAAAAELTGNGFVERAFELLVVVYGLVYIVLAFKAAYGGSIGRAVLRAAVVGAIYYVAVLAAILAVVLPAVFGRR